LLEFILWIRTRRGQGQRGRIQCLGSRLLASVGTITTLSQYIQAYDAVVLKKFQNAKAHGASVLCTGDDLTNVAPMQWFATSSWSHAAVQHAFTTTQNAGNVIGVEACDEVNGLWGTTPFPATQWPLTAEKSIPLNIFSTLTQTIRSVSNTSFAWPVLGMSKASVFKNWCDPKVATHATIYYTDLSGEYCANRKFFAADEAWSMLKIAKSFAPRYRLVFRSCLKPASARPTTAIGWPVGPG